MKKKLIIGVTIAVVVVTSGFFIVKHNRTIQEISYKTTVITRGSVQNTISSTGSLNPVSTIEIGTQVSGTIVKVYVDFNDTVKKSQIIAEIDRQPLLSKLGQVQAAYSRTDALFEQSKSEYERNKPLHEKGIISDQEFSSTKAKYLAQKASLDGARADVETARTNVTYATIRSPINGTVIKRNVDVGQTVAVSLSAPTLFIIAEDLQKMQILANVDESDIGKIKTGQEVIFNVPAYPDLTYKGVVNQVRLQPETVQNVVTYTVVIKASNPDGTLLPGMTANVDFIADKAEDVLLIPSAALRFKPSDEIMANARKNRPQNDRQKGGNFERSGRDQSGADKTGEKAKSENRGVIWILTDSNVVRSSFVRLGISDGTVTEVSGRNLEAGAKVITGIADKKKGTKQQPASKNLFAPSRPPAGGGRWGDNHG
jgi:HlyD family secretion protein